MNHLMIADVQIRTDDAGRFSLNDLHKAAGAEDRHQPAFFFRRPETNELVEEISNSAPAQNCEPVAAAAGRYGGSYAAKEIVYAYAMWISPRFHLQVIRTFDAVATGKLTPSLGKTKASKPPVLEAAAMIPPVLRALRACGIDKNAAVISANQIAAAQTGVNLLAMAGHSHLPTPSQQICFTPTELGKRFCQSAITFNRRLADAGLQEYIGGHWVPTEKGRQHAVVLDTGKAHGNGTPIQQVKWVDSVLAEIAL
ncbi:KilA-N domain-containing protein [Duganella sp. FT94W]|uniref:KilA-N domain-containing protein n=1 Tax=Duganella lactea TaxID=2692173 RepID=A0ABW9V5P5_9BURK|nr:KilA-N domain-containing protein [Duganella lactea]MYM34903.1 KilA-N domain-containing protein [Duganella lactea]